MPAKRNLFFFLQTVTNLGSLRPGGLWGLRARLFAGCSAPAPRNAVCGPPSSSSEPPRAEPGGMPVSWQGSAGAACSCLSLSGCLCSQL